VGEVLQGTVSRAGSRLHVTAELVKASDENTMWSASFDRTTSDLSAMQDSIKRGILAALQVRASPSQAGGVANGSLAGTSDFEAYDLYLKGRFHLNRFEYDKAAGSFRAAVTRDPRFARAHADLAWAYALLPTAGFGSRDSLLALARESAARAHALDSTLVDAWVANGMIFVTEVRLVDAERTLAKAVSLDPGNADIAQTHAFTLGSLGRLDEALAEARRAQRIDPLNVGSLIAIQYTLYLQRQYRRAIDAARPVLDLDPRSVAAYQVMGLAYAFLGIPDSAVVALETAIRIDPGFGGRMYAMFGYAAAGRWADAERARVMAAREGGNSPHLIAGIADLTFGKPDSALIVVERGIELREPLFQDIAIPCDPLFDPLKANPRFEGLMRRLGVKMCAASGRWPIQARAP
jgi:serine/threonine-protein kinase